MGKFKQIIAEQELYRDAEIRRENLNSDIDSECHMRLREIGGRLHETHLPQMEYKGSAAVHVFFAPGLKECVYIPQNCINKDTDEIWASNAIGELTRAIAKSYGRELGKKRSGF